MVGLAAIFRIIAARLRPTAFGLLPVISPDGEALRLQPFKRLACMDESLTNTEICRLMQLVAADSRNGAGLTAKLSDCFDHYFGVMLSANTRVP